jgi:hypothetical protein
MIEVDETLTQDLISPIEEKYRDTTSRGERLNNALLRLFKPIFDFRDMPL